MRWKRITRERHGPLHQGTDPRSHEAARRTRNPVARGGSFLPGRARRGSGNRGDSGSRWAAQASNPSSGVLHRGPCERFCGCDSASPSADQGECTSTPPRASCGLQGASPQACAYRDATPFTKNQHPGTDPHRQRFSTPDGADRFRESAPVKPSTFQKENR